MSANGHPPKSHSWDRQIRESTPAFAAFRCYLEMGDKRSIRLVAGQLQKSSTILGRWSKRWNWVSRVAAYTKTLTAKSDDQALAIVTNRILGSHQVLAITSFLATASLDGALDAQGRFDIKKARRTGTIHALKQIQFYKDGEVKAISLRDKNSSAELMGKHHALWGDDMEDPDEVIARMLGIPKAQLKGMSMEEIGSRFSSVPGEVVDDKSKAEQ